MRSFRKALPNGDTLTSFSKYLWGTTTPHKKIAHFNGAQDQRLGLKILYLQSELLCLALDEMR